MNIAKNKILLYSPVKKKKKTETTTLCLVQRKRVRTRD